MATRKKYKIVLSEKYVRKSENGKEWFQFPVNISGQLVAIQTIIPLDPYTEPDMEQVRKEAYDTAYADAEGIYESGKRAMYQKGLKDAWEAARKICTNWVLPDSVLSEIFGMGKTIDDIMKENTASEVIAKIRAYEQEKEEPKKEQSFTAEEVMRQYLDTFCKRHFCSTCPLHTSEFTCGRGYHFTTKNPISNEEVRRAYAKVLQHEEVG